MQDVAAFCKIKLGPGTLYTVIPRLVEEGWIQPEVAEQRLSARCGQRTMLIQNQPWESFAIIWLGLPLFVAYPLLLGLVRAKLASTCSPQRRRWATAFSICSGSLCLLSGVVGLIAWQHGWIISVRGFEPLLEVNSISTVSDCFARFARSMRKRISG